MTASASSVLAPPSPLQNAVESENPLAGIPDLDSYVTESEQEKLAALKLVADSVAQMCQIANRTLMFHPLNLAVFLAFLAWIGNYLNNNRSDVGIVFTTSAGLIMAGMVTVRWITNPYIAAAEGINLGLLENADVLVSKFGDEVIGTVILGWVDGETKGKRRKWRAEIRGWAVRLRYRGVGEGKALLAQAVEVAKKKGADGIEFAPDHASKCLLPMKCLSERCLMCTRLQACSMELLQRTF